MMAALGKKRLAILAALLLVNALLAAVSYGILYPRMRAVQNRIAAADARTAEAQLDIDKIQAAFQQLDLQKGRFENLRKTGFLSDQNRRDAEEALESIQARAGVISAKVNIRPGAAQDNAEAQKAGYKLLSSPMAIEIQAITDRDLYAYLYGLENFFPGHLTIRKMHIERNGALTDVVLRALAKGEKPPLVKANVEATWRSLILEKDETQAGAAPAAPAALGGTP